MTATLVSDTRSPRARRRMLLAGGALLLLAALGFALRWWTSGRFMIETDNAYVRADVVAIAPRVAGTIVTVAVADNQRVRAGDLLARIDDRDYRIRVADAEGSVEAARADLAAAAARVANLDARSVQQRSAIAQDAAAMSARAADADLATLAYRRQADLARQQITSDQMLETAAADARRTRAGLTEARAKLATSRDALPVLASERRGATADLDKAQAALRRAEAALVAARLDLDRTAIRAPIAGLVGQRSVRAGQYAEVGTPLMALVPGTSYVVANYKETQIARVRPGQPVRIIVDAFGGAEIAGHVDSFAPASGAQFALLPPDNATGNFTKIVQRMPLRIRVDPGQPQASALRPGMSVEAIVDTRGARR
ncbi:HlyD family secretion protein [Sphingomonas lycopersici]|uniref:HlyD family secretion protein n=1 Tax=Sphingomonas lycopersici TaxID=2951807 RepID=A0AA41Z5L0_9SPHN|nr:HlyD family secretion protein [Sphingomonas lycopersici]MCW6533277.1 HlyD family secretion protein [Sphingomonas lycopersici]